MSYCRFRNTFDDLEDCYEHMDLNENDLQDPDEFNAREDLIELCIQIALIYGEAINRKVIENK